MAIGTMTEKVVDKATGLFKKGFATFDKIVFLEDEQQDTLNDAVTAFEIYNKTVTTNIEEIEKSISKVGDVGQVKEIRDAMERLRVSNMQDAARQIAAGENVSIKQAKQFSKDLLTIKQGLRNLDTNIAMSFDGLVDTYVKQTISSANSMKAQEGHFRSLFIALSRQSEYLQQQILQMENQGNLDESQLEVLEANRRDLSKLNNYSEQIAHFSRMGPEEFKKNKQSLDMILSEMSDQVFESKMHMTMNTIDNSIQSLSVDSERLNETMEDLTEAQMSGKEVIAGTAMKLQKGAKGMVSSMVLSSMGFGGLDEALGISEKFSELNLFGQKGLFGKQGLLSNLTSFAGAGGGALAGVGKAAGAAGAVVGAGAAGYAVGTGVTKLIDYVAGEEDFLGKSAARALYEGAEIENMSTSNLIKKWGELSDSMQGIDFALDEIGKFIEIKEKGYTTKSERQSINQAQRMAEVLKKKRGKLEKGAKVRKTHQEELDKDVRVSVAVPDGFEVKEGVTVPAMEEEEIFEEPVRKMTDKTKVVSTQVMGDQIINKTISPKVIAAELETRLDKKGVIPEGIKYLPRTIEDTTNMIIENTKEENKKIVEAQPKAPVILTPPNPPAPVDLSKSVDDPTLIALNNDLFG